MAREPWQDLGKITAGAGVGPATRSLSLQLRMCHHPHPAEFHWLELEPGQTGHCVNIPGGLGYLRHLVTGLQGLFAPALGSPYLTLFPALGWERNKPGQEAFREGQQTADPDPMGGTSWPS